MASIIDKNNLSIRENKITSPILNLIGILEMMDKVSSVSCLFVGEVVSIHTRYYFVIKYEEN